MRAYLDDGADASGNEDEQAGLLIKQVEENHYGAETSPQHWRTKHTQSKGSHVTRAIDTAGESPDPIYTQIFTRGRLIRQMINIFM